MKEILKKIYWGLPLNESLKHKISERRFERILEKEKQYDENGDILIANDLTLTKEYSKYVLESYGKRSSDFKPYIKYNKENVNVNLVAYYLTQFHPNEKNDEWWGKGTTEWNNVNQAIPQYVGHYQPRKPGELGYYDLRIKEVLYRQIELAKNYGIQAFCFYHYWFDGERLLEYPLNKFLNNKDLDIKFFYCWANENWTKRFSGTNSDILMKITQTEDNYKLYIDSVIHDFKDERYYRINGKPVLSVYRPSMIPNTENVLNYWRQKVRQELECDLYIIAVQERDTSENWIDKGFDAESEFQPKQIQHNCKNITNNIKAIRKDFAGSVYDYKDMVENKKYIIKNNLQKKVYPAVMPMWDNTARRNFRGIIFDGATPELYKTWLSDVIKRVCENKELDDKMIFINAWNEWGEGAYLEPDAYYGYAYLQATKESLATNVEKSLGSTLNDK